MTQSLRNLDRVENVGQMILRRLAHALFAIGRNLGPARQSAAAISIAASPITNRIVPFVCMPSTFMLSLPNSGRKNSATGQERGTSGAKAQRILNHSYGTTKVVP